ncbi:MAG: M16 family metallopeptidase [Thermodesulfobacteriota bacterium]
MLLVFRRFLIPQFAFRNPKLKYLLLILIFFMLAMGLQELNLYAMPSVQRMTLSNELVLLASGEHSLPFVTIQLLVDSGSRRDPSGEEGLAYLTAKGLLHGTSKRTINQINEELDFLGASLSSSSGRDYATLTLKILKKDLEKGFDLFMEVLTQPLFPDEEIKREIEKTLAAIQSEEDQPEESLKKLF